MRSLSMITSSAAHTALHMPSSIIASLDNAVQETMLDLAIRFESIDNLIKHELDNPHKLKRNDEDLLGPVSYKEADKNEFATLVKEHDQDEVLTYLDDRRYPRIWSIVFNSYCRTWARGNIHYPDMAQTRIYEIEGIAYGLKELFEKSCHTDQLPRYVKDGIKMRLTALDTLLDTCEAIISRHDRRTRIEDETYDKQPLMVMFPRRGRIPIGSILKSGVQARPQTKAQVVMSALVNDRSIVGLTSLISVTGISMEMAAFFGTALYTKENFSRAELWNYLQAFLIATLALAITVLLLQKESLSGHATVWVNWWALLSLISGALAPSIYFVAGPAWSNLLAIVSSICAAFVTLQLIQALQKAEIPKPHIE